MTHRKALATFLLLIVVFLTLVAGHSAFIERDYARGAFDLLLAHILRMDAAKLMKGAKP